MFILVCNVGPSLFFQSFYNFINIKSKSIPIKNMYRPSYSESSSSDSDSLNVNEKTIDLSHKSLDYNNFSTYLEDIRSKTSFKDDEVNPLDVHTLNLYQNQLVDTPSNLTIFRNLRVVDISSNRLKRLPDILLTFPLSSLIAKNNSLQNDSLPKSFDAVNKTLTNLNLSGNCLTHFPLQILDAKHLLYVYLGGNRIQDIPMEVASLTR